MEEIKETILNILQAPKEAVIAQLKFPKVAGCKASKPFYFQAETRIEGERRVFTLEELKVHVRAIIQLNDLSSASSTTTLSEQQHFRTREGWEERAMQ